MKPRHPILLLTLAIAALGAGSSAASAAPIFNLDIHHNQTNFAPGGRPVTPVVKSDTQGSPTADEVQAVFVGATAGKFSLSFGGDTTPALPYNASAGIVQAALRALPSIGSPNVTVAEFLSEGNYKVTFEGALADTDVTQLAIASAPAPSNLTLASEYWFSVDNVGDTATSGTVTLTIKLQNGLTRHSVRRAEGPVGDPVNWSCPGSPGDSSIVCTTSDPISRHTSSDNLAVTVDVAGNLEPGSSRIASAKVEGGTAAKVASASELTRISAEPAGFGILPESFVPDFFQADGLTTVRESGAHPPLLTVPFDFNSIDSPSILSFNNSNVFQKAEDGSVRDLTVDLPPGFLGNPTAVGECSQADFATGNCQPSSQVGKISVGIPPFPVTPDPEHSFSLFTLPVYNLAHPRGSISDLAFVLAGNPVHVKVSLDPANHYAIVAKTPDINETLPPFSQKLTLWGVPADHSHDSERCPPANTAVSIKTDKECGTDLPPKPFLTVPFNCGEDHTFRLHHYDSWQETGVFGPEIDYVQPGQTTNCDKPRFNPEVSIEPTGKQANTPTGLDIHVKIAQNENPNALATPPVKRFTVRLPEGMSFSPSFADGLKGCTLAQMKLGTNDPIECPDASRIGEVGLHTPLLPKPAEGSMYLAAQGDNPFGSTFALLLVIHDTEERGALIKIPGRIDVDPVTGQITTVFDDTPQFPFDDLTLKFRSGPRAPLVSPPTCGKQTIGVEVASYAQPQNPVDASSVYEVTEGPNGTPCPPEASKRPFHPSFSGGTLSRVAGAYSPFLFRLARGDDEQELSQVTTVLPRGLLAKIAGIPACSDQAIASISTAEGAGAQELAHPACPAASRIGTVSAGLGAGPGPNYFPGKVYLAGPYKGAPLSLAIVAPGLAGPFDLGNVVVRAAIRVDRSTAQVTAVSDPFPTILHGVILRVRDVRLRVDRPETTLNPTSCAPMAVEAKVTGVGGDLGSTADDSLFSASSPFQAGDCASLGFKPDLSLQLFGGTKRGSHPKLRATLKMPSGGANIGAASVALPHSEFLEQAHIKTVCTRVQFAAGACPADSVYGTAVAKTPLFSEPLSGPVYLRSSSNLLPDMVAVLKGPAAQPIEVELVGRIDSVKGGIRNTFDVVPDAPVQTFTLELQGGKKGLLVNSRDLCQSVNRATARFTGQNGAVFNSRPILRNSCKKPRKKKAAAKARRTIAGWLPAAF
jgi:hypothetical protein